MSNPGLGRSRCFPVVFRLATPWRGFSTTVFEAMGIGSFDLAIVGGGVIGASVLLAAAQRGLHAVLVERDRLGGSPATGRSGGIVRVYHSHSALARLAVYSRALLQEWAEGSMFRRCGVLLFGSDSAEVTRQRLLELGDAARDVRLMTADDLPAGIEPGAEQSIVFEADSGTVDPPAIVCSFAAAAESMGALVLEGTNVINVRVERERVVGLTTSAGDLVAPNVVLATGCYRAPPFGGFMPIQWTTRRVVAQRLRATDGCRIPKEVVVDEAGEFYTRPINETFALVGQPSDCERGEVGEQPPLGSAELARLQERAAVRIPALAHARYSGQRLGMDGYTPDRQPVVGPVPGVHGLYVACAFNGGGVKIAPAVGQTLADTILAGRVHEALRTLGPGRVEAGSLRHPAATTKPSEAR